MPLPSIGTLSYNGVVFDSAAKVRVACEYEKDSSGRTTTNQKITLTVTALLAPTDDESVESLRAKLGEQGKSLIYADNAFPLNINNADDGASIRDVAFGPAPHVLNWRPLGGGTSAEIIWRCVTTIPACGGEPSGFSLREFVYQVGFDINERGYTTRTISGYFKIPHYRFDRASGASGAGTRDLTITADTYRELVLSRFFLLSGYQRRSHFTLSEDKAKLNFTITDSQIESVNAWPPNVTNIHVRHRMGWQMRERGGRVSNSINGQITLREGFGAGWALAAWKSVVNARLQQVFGNAGVNNVQIESLQAEEDLFGITHSFSMSYWITGDPDDAVQANTTTNGNTGNNGGALILNGERFLELSGFGTPMQNGVDWNPWDQSRVDDSQGRGPHGLRGTSGISWQTDHITDQCDDAPLKALVRVSGFVAPPASTGGKSSVFKARCPKPKESWIEYKHSWAEITRNANLEEVKKLAKANFGKPPPTKGGPIITEQLSEANDRALVRSLKSGRGQLWVLRGFGKRVCYALPRLPSTIKLAEGKATLTLIRGIVKRDIETNPLGLKIHSGPFAAIYVSNKELKEPPANFVYP